MNIMRTNTCSWQLENGMVKKTPMVEYEHVRKNGLQAIVLRDGDELIEVKATDNSQDILLVTRKGNVSVSTRPM